MSTTASEHVKITNKLGLHARPATMFVEAAGRFNADIVVGRADNVETVDGKSIMQLLMLAATCGTVIEIAATGDDAQQAVSELVTLVNSDFEE